MLNGFIEETTTALNGKLNIVDNLMMDIKDLDVTVDVTGNPVPSKTIQLSGIEKVIGLSVIDTRTTINPSILTLDNITTNAHIHFTQEHKLTTGQIIRVVDSNSTPSIDGNYKIIVIDPSTVQLPVIVTIAGNSGKVIPDESPSSNPFISFVQQGNLLEIKKVTGLVPFVKYNLKLLIFKG